VQPHYTVEELLFNSRYVLKLRMEPNSNSLTSSLDLAEVVMDTPRCEEPSHDFRHCHIPTDLTTESPSDVSGNVTSAANVTESRK
jgi:hypothetical protein